MQKKNAEHNEQQVFDGNCEEAYNCDNNWNSVIVVFEVEKLQQAIYCCFSLTCWQQRLVIKRDQKVVF